LLLISSLLAFQSGRSISLRTMQWSSIGPEQLAMVLSTLDAQINAIGRDPDHYSPSKKKLSRMNRLLIP
jgi:hypothetical protein